MNSFRLIAMTAGFALAAAHAHAAPIVNESFDYSTGNLNTASGGVWAETFKEGANSRYEVGTGSLAFERNGNAVVTSGNSATAFVKDGGDDIIFARSLGQTFNSGTVWFGWLQVNATGNNQDTFLALGDSGVNGFINNANTTHSQVVFGRDGSTSNNLAYATAGSTAFADTGIDGVTVNGSDSSSAAPTVQANFLVVSLDFDNNEAAFYVNPDPLDVSDNDFSVTGVNFTGSGISHVSIARQNNHFSGDFLGTFDEIRIGDEFIDVTGIPEPTTLTMGLIGLTLLASRRRVKA